MIDERNTPPDRPVLQYLALALISGSVLAYELFVMRVFACAGWSHFGSMVISIVMLGFGVFSTILCVLKDFFRKRLLFCVKLSLLLLGPSMAVCNALAQRVDFNPIFLISDPAQKFMLGSYFLIYLLPFLLGAMFLGLIFLFKKDEFGTAYFANMAGSALGGAAILLGMYRLMPERLLLIPLALWLPGALLWFGRQPGKRAAYALVAVSALLSVSCSLWMEQIKVSQYKAVSYARQFPDSRRVGLLADPFGLLEIYSSSYFHFAPGLSDNAMEYLEEMPRNAFLGMYMDGDGPMGVMRNMEGKYLDYFNFLPMSMPFLIETAPEVLVVQFGGGISTGLALKMGAKEVTVAEGNPLVVEAVRDNPFVRDFTGRILDNPKVRLIENEGRIYVGHTKKQFDLIDLSLADSTGLSMPGGSSIQEKFTYTTETFSDCIEALRESGILSITVWNREEPPKSTLKLAATLAGAAQRSNPNGIENRFFAAHNYLSTFTLLYKKDGFTDEQTRTLLEYCARMSFEPVYYPGADFGPADSQKLLDRYRTSFFEIQDGASDPGDDTGLSMTDLYRLTLGCIFRGNFSAVRSSYVFAFEPLTNDRPYFAGYTKPWDIGTILTRLDSICDEWGYLLLWATLLLSCFFGLLLLAVPVLFGWRAIFSKEPGKLGIILYFICLGIGYIAVEIAYISKCIICLGNPSVSFAVLVTGMMLFSGVGSYFSGRLIQRAGNIVAVLCAAIAAMLIFYAYELEPLLGLAGAWPYASRVLFCLALLFPVAFLLGFPFAMGMTVLSKTAREDFFVWAWGINGSFSVVGSVMVPVIAVNWGFFCLLILCAALYLTAIPCFLNFQFRRPAAVAGCIFPPICILLLGISPGCPEAAQGSLTEGLSFVEAMASAPFPYEGTYDDTGQCFFDWTDPNTGKRFHTNRYGLRLPEPEHYIDNSVLFHLPPGFSPEKPFAFLVFFHGNNSDIQQTDRDYQIAEQVDGSGRNVILILPQLAKNATDSSPGKFFNHNAFKSFMVEASEILARRLGEEHLPALRAAPVFLAAFSGGYKSTAYVLDRGGEDRRIRVVFLIDALYEDLDKFGKWITDGAESRLIAAIYTQGTENNTRELADRISTQRIKINWTWPASLAPGSVSLIQSSNEHLMTPLLGPPERPLSHFLSTLDRRLFDAP
jgi:hypothetical protein